MKTITILFIAAIVAIVLLAIRMTNATRQLKRKIDLIDTAFAYSKYMYNEASKFRVNAKKGNVRSFYSGRMSAAVDMLNYLGNVEKVWKRENPEDNNNDNQK